jgi:hypothetical protein
MLFRKFARPSAPRPRTARRLRLPQARPTLEALETRVTPYAVSGNAWPNPQLITISFMPDGTFLAYGMYGNYYSNLISALVKSTGATYPSQVENVILKAAQTWAQQTNINFTVVNDSGLPEGSIGAGYEQGDPNFGDIRIGGANFTNIGDTSLAETYYPPQVNNYSLAGDVEYNTGYGFHINAAYDLFTLSMHEIGHALGMAHSTSSSAVMYPYYTTVFTGLSSDDIAGIRSIYSGGAARSHDAYNSNGNSNSSFSTAADITSTIDPTALTSVVTGLDITTTNQLEYFKFTAPSNSSGTMTIAAQSTGLSLLTPKLLVYNSSQTLLGSASAPAFSMTSSTMEDGATLKVTVSGVTPGATYYVAVRGVDTTAFSTGAYALTLNLGTGPNPTVPLPNTQVLDGSPLQAGGGSAQTPTPGQDTPGSDNGPEVAPTTSNVPTSPTVTQPAVTHPTADANLVGGLVSHSTAALAVTPAAASHLAAQVTTSLAVPQTTVTAQAQVEAGSIRSADKATENVAEQLPAPAVQGDESEAIVVPPQVVAPAPAVQPAVAPAADDVWRDDGSAVPTEQSASAPAVAEATASDWTPDGALAAASVLFGGAWVRWHAAHQGDERRRHAGEVNEKQGAS